MFKRNNSGKNSPTEIVSPIDEDEQTKITEEIKKLADSQSIRTRTVFRYIFMVVAVILLVCLFYTLVSPYKMEHQKHFRDIIPLYGFLSYYSGSIYCYTISSFIVQESSKPVHSILLNLAYFIAAMSLVSWLVIFNTFNITNPVFFWLPLSNVAAIALAKYIDSDTRDMVSSAEGLEQYKYSFKGV